MDSASTILAERVGSPWDERSLLSPEFLSKAQHLSVSGQIKDDPAARYQRVALADEDARRLHQEHIQRGSGAPIPFESILLHDPAAPGSERVLVNLACKGILNASSHGGAPHDIKGDCRLVLTEIAVGAERIRRLYFFQVAPAAPQCPHDGRPYRPYARRPNCQCAISSLLCDGRRRLSVLCARTPAPPADPARTALLPQAGTERRELSACEYAERETRKEQSKDEVTRREGNNTVTERAERSEERTHERRDFAALAVRQTVSYLDVLHVEEQLVHAYCEQVGAVNHLDWTPPSPSPPCPRAAVA
jgi:hypothetical protein